MGVYLLTEHMLLRNLVPDDVHRFNEFESDPEVMRFLNGGGPLSREAHQALIELSMRFAEDKSGNGAQAGFGIWAALSNFTLEFAGWFHLFPLQVGEDPELGYHLARPFWGRGLATEVSGAILAKAQSRGMRTCTARAMVANVASTRVMAKIGMRPESEYVETGFPGDDKRAVIYRWHAAETAPNPGETEFDEDSKLIRLPFAA